MIHVIVCTTVKELFITFIDIFKANVLKVIEEKGCIGYAPARDLSTGMLIQETDPAVIILIEKWARS